MNKKPAAPAGRLIHDIIPSHIALSSHFAAQEAPKTTSVSPVYAPPVPPATPRHALGLLRILQESTLSRMDWRAIVSTRQFVVLASIIVISLTASVAALRATPPHDAKTADKPEPASSVLSAEKDQPVSTQATAPVDQESTVPSPAEVVQSPLATPDPVAQPATTTPVAPAQPAAPEPEPTVPAPTPEPSPTPVPEPEPEPTPEPEPEQPPAEPQP